MAPTIAVIGGGISGLTVAYELSERSQRLASRPRIVCLEGSDTPGGNIRTDRADGFTCESGPTGFLDNAPCTLTLARRLGLEERLIQADPASAARFIFRRGKLRRVPTGPLSFLSTDVLSITGRLRLCAEPLMPRGTADDESVHDFARRRIGREAANVLVDAMVSGVFAGDSRRLSLEATFPVMRRMEAAHRSLFRAMLARRRMHGSDARPTGGPAGPGGRLTSFHTGLQELIDALTRELGDRLRVGCPVAQVSDMGVRGFRVHLAEGAPMDVSAVVAACPAWKATELFKDDEELCQHLVAIPTAPVAVVHLGYSRAALGDQPQGFGFLVPRGQGPRILGTLWPSNIFEGRAPDQGTLLTTMVGGAHDPEGAGLAERELVRLVKQDLATVLGIATEPYFVRVVRHPRGIPQYELGHLDRVAAIEQRLEQHPGLFLCGNSYRGVSINACIEEAPHVAESALEFLACNSSVAAL